MEVILANDGSNLRRREGEKTRGCRAQPERAESHRGRGGGSGNETRDGLARRGSSQSSSDDLAPVTRTSSYPPSSSTSAGAKERVRRRGGSRRRKPSDGTHAKSPLGYGHSGNDGTGQGGSGRKQLSLQQSQRCQSHNSSTGENVANSPHSGSHSAKKGSEAPALESGRCCSGGGSGENRANRENSGGRHHTEDFQAQYTLDEYSSAIFGDELTEEWTEIESFSDLDEDDLLLQQEAEEKLFRRHQQVFTSKSLPLGKERFTLSPDKLKSKDWGGQGGPGTDIAALGFMGDLAPPPDTAVVCNPLFMNHKAQDMISSKKTAWNVPSGEDTLVKRLNPLYQNLLLTAILEESRQEWPSVITKKKLFPLRRKQSLTDVRLYPRPDRPEKKTENPLYRKVITNDAYARLRKD